MFIPPKLAMKGQVRFEVADGSVSIYQNNKVHTPEIVNMRYPDISGVIPTDCSGEQAAFNPTLMRATLKAIDEIGKAEGYKNKPTRVRFNGNTGMRVDCKMLPNTVALVIPLRE